MRRTLGEDATVSKTLEEYVPTVLLAGPKFDNSCLG